VIDGRNALAGRMRNGFRSNRKARNKRTRSGTLQKMDGKRKTKVEGLEQENPYRGNITLFRKKKNGFNEGRIQINMRGSPEKKSTEAGPDKEPCCLRESRRECRLV